MSCILVNAMVMSVRHRDEAAWVTRFLETSNYVFIAVFTLEAVIKILGLRLRAYFSDNWNRFDFVIVFVSLVAATGVGSGAVTMLRLFRVGRLLRVLGRGRLHTLFTTIVAAMPQVLNVGLLVVVLFFMFGAIGVALFGDVPPGDDGITQYTSFRNVYYALITLYTISTTEGWADVMAAGWQKDDGCDETATCG
eukprot:gene46554-44370_t